MSSESDDLVELVEVLDTGHSLNHDRPQEDHRDSALLSNTDEQVYDRQIRLWGLQAQKKIMNSRVLFLGKNGIQEECMKNLLLAGSCSETHPSGMNVTLANDHIVSEDDVKLSFFLTPEDVGTEHATSLCKRMSTITTNDKRISGIHSRVLVEDGGAFKFDEPGFLENFDVVCVSTTDYALHKLVSLPTNLQARVNSLCSDRGVAFFASLSCGTYGYFFTDLNRHTVLETFNKKSESVTIEYRNLEAVLKEVGTRYKLQPKYPRNCEPVLRSLTGLVFLLQAAEPGRHSTEQLEEVTTKYKADPETLREMVGMYGSEFPVTSSILGGYLALEVRKFVTKQHETVPNFCAFDMNSSSVSTAMI